jgi:S-layer protein
VLDTVTLSGGTTASATLASGTLQLNETTKDTSTIPTSLALNLDGGGIGAMTGTHLAKFTTLNVNASANSTVANITAAAATTLTAVGTGVATFTAQTLGAVTTISSTGGGLSLGSALANGVTFTGGEGIETITVGATTKAINVGNGDNSVTVTAAPGTGGSITAGTGTDTLSMTEALGDTVDATTVFRTAVTGFEKLSLTTVTGSKTVNVANIGVGINDVATTAATGLTLTGLTTGANIRLSAATNAVTSNLDPAAIASSTDVQNVFTTNATGTAYGTVTLGNTETVNLNFTDTAATAINTDTITLVAAAVKTVVITGNTALTLTNTNTTITSLDASGITDGVTATNPASFTWAVGALAAASTIVGSATGTNAVTLTAATKPVTFTGGAGADVVTIGTNTQANVIDLGTSGTGQVNQVAAGAAHGNNTVTSTSTQGDNIVLGNGNNTITAGAAATGKTNTLTVGDGNNTITGGTGIDAVTIGSGNNTVNLGGGSSTNQVTINAVSTATNSITGLSSGVDTIVLSNAPTSGGFYTTVTGMTAGDKIDFSAVTLVASTVTPLGNALPALGSAANFASYLDAATATVIADGAAQTIKWFQFQGDTFIVVDNSFAANTPDDTATFQDGIDSVITLAGLIDLSTSTVAADVLTIV